MPSETLRKRIFHVLLTMIDPTTGPLITHHKAVLSFMSQQLQSLMKEWGGERDERERYNKDVNKLTTIIKAQRVGD